MSNKIITIDIGGTNTRVAVMNDKYQKLDHISFATNTTDAVENFTLICDFINKHPDITKAGLSAPGPTDYARGIFKEPINVKWTNFNCFEFIKEHTNIQEIKADNDANLMALANHFHFKNEKGITQFFTISTGLGAGLIINNQIFQGSNYAAQEVAKLPVAWKKEDGKDLTEGALELFAAGSGLEFRAKKYGFNSAKAIFESYDSDQQAKMLIDDGIEALANAIAICLSLINPNLFVFDGSVARHNQWYVEKAIAIAKKRSFQDQYVKTKFKFTELGDDSALIGAYLLVK